MPKPWKEAPENQPSDLAEFDKANGPFFVYTKEQLRPIQFAETGVASEAVTPPMTVMELFDKAVAKNPNKVALRHEGMGVLKKNQLVPEPVPLKKWARQWTWNEYREDVRKAGRAMLELGVAEHDTVSIFGFNCPEWFIAFLGAMHCGASASGIYPSDNAEQVQYKSHHSNTSVAFVEDEIAFNKYGEVFQDLPYLKALVCWAHKPSGDLKRDDGSVVRCLTFEEFISLSSLAEESALDARAKAVKPNSCGALIYTSGTTGRPKAVMISHDTFIYETSAVFSLRGELASKKEEERIISYLPLSHIAGMMVDIVFPIFVTAADNSPAWFSVSFARPYDLKFGSLGARLGSVEPTIFLGVPRVYEKIAEKLKAIGAKTTGIKKQLSTSAKKRGLKYQKRLQVGGSGKAPSWGPLAIYKKLLGVIKKKLGLAQVKFLFSGAAPLSAETQEYFASLNLAINETYGLSENCGSCTWSSVECHLFGTVGFPLPGCEVKVFKIDGDTKIECSRVNDIFKAPEEAQGEICIRGRNVMLGYLANPNLGEDHIREIKEKNEATIDSEGWLHTGDKGAMSNLGFLKITGRYKELLIGAGGENIAPVPIEDAWKAEAPYISNLMMIGDKRKFMSMLVTLKCVGATGELPGTNELDGPAKVFGITIEDAIKNDKVVEDLFAVMKRVNENGDATPSNAAQVRRFSILPIDFSVSTDDLTASFKLKRSVVAEKYASLIEAIYDSSDDFVPYSVVGSYDEVHGEKDLSPTGSFKGLSSLEFVDDETAANFKPEEDDNDDDEED